MSASGETTTLVNEENAQNRRLTDVDVPEPLNVAAARSAENAVGVTTAQKKSHRRRREKRSGSGRILSKKIGDVTTALKKTLLRRHTKKKDDKGRTLAKKTDDATTALKKIHRPHPRKKRGRGLIPPKLLGGSLQLTNVQSHQK